MSDLNKNPQRSETKKKVLGREENIIVYNVMLKCPGEPQEQHDHDRHKKFFTYKIIHMAHITHVYMILIFKENSIIADLGAWKSYE